MVGRRRNSGDWETGDIEMSGDPEYDGFPAHTGEEPPPRQGRASTPRAANAKAAAAADPQWLESEASISSRRHRRQTLTFLVFFLLILLLGVFALLAFFDKVPLPVSTGKPAASATCTPGKAALTPADVRVSVYNATKRNGLAAQVTRELQTRKFVVPNPAANDPQATVSGAALLRHGPNGKAAAELVANNIVSGPVTYQQDTRAGTDVDLVLGQSFAIKAAPTATPSAAASPTCKPSS